MVVSPYNTQLDSVSSGMMGNNTRADVRRNTPSPPVPSKAAEQVPHRYFPSSPGRGQSGSACSDPTHSSTTKHASVAERRKEDVDVYAPNVVIFGESGVGKSSVINLIAGQDLARTSNDALGCTFHHVRYPIRLDGMTCALWDTAGLDEGSEGTVPSKLAENNLRVLMGRLADSGGINLIVYCIRASRLKRALKRNYDLFYVTVCRKKVPVALVVTCLEGQSGKMETWWTMNETTLRKSGMRFDAHACVTTLNAEDHLIQERRSDSRMLLRELVVKYSKLPAWKSEPSLISRVLPAFRSIFRGTSATGDLGNITTIRKVIVYGLFPGPNPGTTAIWDKSISRIGSKEYEFLRVDNRSLNTHTPRALEDAGLLIFYTSALVENLIPLMDINALKRFYDCAGGRICPVIVILRGCNDEQVAQACHAQVTSYHSDIRAHFVPFPHTDDAQARLDEKIESLCIEQVEAGARNFFRRYMASNRFLSAFVDASFW